MDRLPDSLVGLTCSVPIGLSFRLAAATDLYDLHTRFYAHQPLLRFRDYFQSVLKRQERDRSFWLVAAFGAKIVGNGVLAILPTGAELANLYVSERYRNRGIGTALIQLLVDLAQQLGQASVEIGVAPDNERALALYQKLGFGQDRYLRLSSGRPAIILRKEVLI